MTSVKTSSATTAKLSVMMFLQFFIWGAWYTMVGQYLTVIKMGESIGWVYTVGPIAAIISPLFLGMVADRFFSSERVLSVLMLVGGLAMFLAPGIAAGCAANWAETVKELTADGTPVTEAIAAKYGDGYFGIFPPIIPDQLPFIGILLLHMLCYMPTLGADQHDRLPEHPEPGEAVPGDPGLRDHRLDRGGRHPRIRAETRRDSLDPLRDRRRLHPAGGLRVHAAAHAASGKGEEGEHF